MDSLNIDNCVYSPEELAWKLIMDENINSSAIMAFSDENSKEILFEILITIYIEMLFNYYKLNYLENTLNDENEDKICDEFENFKLDMTKVNINVLTSIFVEKFKLIKFILNISEITYDIYEFTKKNRYCTLLLKDSPSDSVYFIFNEHLIDPNKKYHFVLNSLYIPKDNLRDIYCTISINNKYYKISFCSLI
jgi:uncharacterized protein YrzB (UPF0473 family)